MNGRGEDTSEDTTRPGMQCKDNTRKGGKGREDQKVPQMLLTPAYATKTWERVLFIWTLFPARNKKRERLLSTLYIFLKQCQNENTKHFNNNEIGVDTRKRNIKRARKVFAWEKQSYVYKRESLSTMKKGHVKIDKKS